MANSNQFDALLQQAVAQTVSARRYELLPTEAEYYPDELLEMLQAGDRLSQDANCKIIYTDNGNIFINGEWIDELSEVEQALLADFANGKSVDWQHLQQLADHISLDLLLDSLCDWLDNGWLLVESADDV